MPELFNVLAPVAAYETFQKELSPLVQAETIATEDALDRVTAQEIRSPIDLPEFPRSTMDGYALRAQDTYGASEGLPAYLNVIAEIEMGNAPDVNISIGEGVKIHTGGMIADGADAVVMVENTQEVDDATIEVMCPVAMGENVIQIGEDVKRDEVLLSKGYILRPQDIGGLMAVGVTKVAVAKRPRVAIISTGDEVVPPQVKPQMGQIRDINSYTASTLVTRAGGIPVLIGIVPDNYKALKDALSRALNEADMAVISAGSSVSARDITADVINDVGDPGVIVHGVSIKPGKPTILALIGDKPVFGLPGNPVSAMVIFDLFITPTIYRLSGCENPPSRQVIRGKVTRNIASTAGREDYVQVRIEEKDGEVWVDPVFGKSNLIYTLIKADGTMKVPLESGGLSEGAIVDVKLF